ncbi:phage tail assembly chaperone [Companilactobacillus hulinensis]|uniref:phage tail assembly chaperone n=1 Tax=Companilactobacillus hulinensis TaxID=2486007 RepID=UPI000F774473|nr:hypothetical protein [Companilactobacillus hulinensis]
MATSVSDFLMENVEQQVETKEISFKGFKSPFVIKSITAEENSALQKQATRRIKDKQTRQITTTTDQDKYIDLLICASVVTPDLTNAELQKSWDCVAKPADVLKKMLLVGQYAELSQEIQEISGFDTEDVNDLSDEVKK